MIVGWMYERMDGCMDGWMDVWMDGCMGDYCFPCHPYIDSTIILSDNNIMFLCLRNENVISNN